MTPSMDGCPQGVKKLELGGALDTLSKINLIFDSFCVLVCFKESVSNDLP
jgi:hypothetical protein